jgi:hypothetical protein
MTAILIPTTDVTNYGNKPGDGPLRPGGQSGQVAAKTVNDKRDLPDTRSKAAEAQAAAVTLCRDLVAGTGRLRDKSGDYLPQGPGEETADYQIRVKRSVLFNVFRKTVEGLSGFVFRKDPVLGKDVPPVIVGHWENIDLAGTHGDVFAQDLLQDALTTGHDAILVDYPNAKALSERLKRPLTAQDEIDYELRPYWIPIKKENILSWRTVKEQGRTLLAQVVLQECAQVPDGDFGEREQIRYRVLWRDPAQPGPVGYRLLEITKDKKSVVEIESGFYTNQDEIPLAEIVTSGRKGLFESDPPLLDMAYLNVAHFQQWSDYATSIHKTCVPIFVTTGLDSVSANDGTPKPTLVLGPNTYLGIPNPQGKAEYVSHDGAALNECRQSLTDLVSNMTALGLDMLSSQKRAAETAEAKKIDKAGSDSALAVTARGLQDGIERALDFHAKYLLINDGGSITINRDFEDMSLPADLMTAYVTAARDTGFPVRLLLEAWQAGGRIPADADLDEVEQEMMANAAAKERQRKDELANQAANLLTRPA